MGCGLNVGPPGPRPRTVAEPLIGVAGLLQSPMPTAPYQEFAGRLHKALDRARFPADRARTGALANRYAVTRETARKWLAGLALPELERMITLATDFRVAFEWLATGRGVPELDAGAGGGKVTLREHREHYIADDTLAALHAWLESLSAEQREGLLQFVGVKPRGST